MIIITGMLTIMDTVMIMAMRMTMGIIIILTSQKLIRNYKLIFILWFLSLGHFFTTLLKHYSDLFNFEMIPSDT